MAKTNRASAEEIKMRKLRAQAVALREQDFSYRDIAKQLNRSVQVAFKFVKQGLEELAPVEDAKTIRQMKLVQLEQLCRVYYTKSLNGDDHAATQTYIKLHAEHSKLAGIYPAQPTAGTGFVDNSVKNIQFNIVGRPGPGASALPPPGADSAYPMNRSEMTDQRYPHRIDHQPEPNVPPPQPPQQSAPADDTTQGLTPAEMRQRTETLRRDLDLRPKTYRERVAAHKERALAEGWPAGPRSFRSTSNPVPRGLGWMK